jgi:hypothetical protein
MLQNCFCATKRGYITLKKRSTMAVSQQKESEIEKIKPWISLLFYGSVGYKKFLKNHLFKI